MFNVLTMTGAVATLLSSLLVGPGPSSIVVTNPPGDKIVIDLVTVNGSGCPAGTAAVAVAPDNTAFTVTYSKYLAQVGVGAGATDARKNCQLNVIVHVPSGFSYAIAETDYRGFGHLEAGATGVEKASYYFQGSQTTVGISHTFNGPLDDNWQATDKADLTAMVWSPCGALRNFNINTELRVNAGTSDPRTTTSFMTMDSTDSAISTIYHFAWRNCS
jgi:hypothetical protein